MKKQIIVKLLNGAVLVTAVAAMAQTASASIDLPDAGTTTGLLGVAFCGLIALRRFFR
jgi:hypothetical protein